MKKFFAVILSLSLIVCITACSSTVASPFDRSGFLQETSVKTVANVSETNEYSVSFSKAEKPEVDLDFTFSEEPSYLKTYLSVYESDGEIGEAGKKYYLFKTELSLNGTYSFKGETADVADRIETEVYFCPVGEELRPVYSKRTAVATSPEGNASKIEFIKYGYTYEIKYNGGNASVSLKKDVLSYETYSAPNEYVLENVFENNYIDNEQILFAPRAMTLSDLSATFKTVDALSKTARDMKLKFTEEETVKFEEKTSRRAIGGKSAFSEYRSSVKVAKLSLSINSSYAGAEHTLYFAAQTEANEYQRLIKAEYPAAYGSGSFIFELINSSIEF